MTNKDYKRAKELENKIEDYKKLHTMACKPLHKFTLTGYFLGIEYFGFDCDCYETLFCDKELTKLIRDYAYNKLKELKKELDTLVS